jgi:hypothetical protein
MIIASKRVLVIDDDPDIQNWFLTFQKNEGPLSIFFHLEEKGPLPDLIFVDGTHLAPEKLSEILRIAFHYSVPLVYMSTRESESLSIEGAHFMRKPLERKAVDFKIKALLKI